VALTKSISSPIRRRAVDQFDAFSRLTASIQEILLGIRVVKSFGAEKYEMKRLIKDIGNIVRVNMRFGIFKHIETPVRETINTFVIGVIALFAAREVLLGNLTATGFFMFLYVGRSIIMPIANLGNTYTLIQTTLASSKRVFELFEEKPTLKDGSEPIDRFERSIEIRNVSFSYDKTPALRNVTFDIIKGEMVALVGPSGAGKSTLTDLILRFYDPQVGRISIDGKDLRTLKLSKYRSLFGVVSQECLLFNATVRDNIAYGREGLTEEDIINAAKVANAHDFITRLPDGYESFVGDRGIRLSGGQRQRIAIARAVVGRPDILILDEATSSLDSESEKMVQEAINKIIKDTTAIVIAHRLSTVLNADRIVVLSDGAVEAIGTHDELLEKCPLYRKLYQIQFKHL
jgi:subfamily B ATP-binding cassette protein MsbA